MHYKIKAKSQEYTHIKVYTETQ